MNSMLATRLGPLAWVKPEIDYALERLRSLLDEYFRAPAQGDAALASAIAALREVTGALQIIGVEPLGKLSCEIEELLGALARNSLDPTSGVRDIVVQATNAIADRLADLAGGDQDSAMCLLPILRQLAQARKAVPFDERTLFCPDLNRLPPTHPEGEPLNGEVLVTTIRAQRSSYQRGMLSWLRESDDGLKVMQDAIRQIERSQPHPRDRAQWWVAVAFFDGLLRNAIPTNDEIKRLAGRFDRHLADFASSGSGSENLMREMLFHLAHCEPVSSLVCEVRSLYELDRLTEPANAETLDIDSTKKESVSTIDPKGMSAIELTNASSGDSVNALRDLSREMLANLQHVEEALDTYFRGQTEARSLTPLIALMRNVVGALRVLGTDAAAQIMDDSASMVDELAGADRQPSGEEVALLAESLSSVVLFIQALDHGDSEELRALEAVLTPLTARDALPVALHRQEDDPTHFEAVEGERIAATNEGAKQPGDLESLKVTSEPGGEEVSDDDIAAILDHFDLTALRDEDSAHSGDARASTDGCAAPIGYVPEPNVAMPPMECDAWQVGCLAPSTNPDPEIVAIFVDEANTILDSMCDLIARVRARPDDRESLSVVRRNFHTLKGSSRMVGFAAIGDAAWTLESLLNSWLETERSASEGLIVLANLARELLAESIANIRQCGQEAVGTAELEGLAQKVAVELRVPPEDPASLVAVTAVAPVESIKGEAPGQPADEPMDVGDVALPATLYEIFLEEAGQNLGVLRTSLAALKVNPDASILEEFSRAAHTLGGIARSAGFTHVGELAAALENIHLGGVDRERVFAVSALAIDALAVLVSNVGAETRAYPPEGRFSDLLNEAVSLRRPSAPEELQSRLPDGVSPTLKPLEVAPERRVLKDDIDVQLVPVFLEEVRDLVPLIGNDLRCLRSSPKDAAAHGSLQRVLHTIKGAARMVGAMRIGELVHLMEGRLEVASVEGGITAETLERLEDEFDRLTSGFDALERSASERETPLTFPALSKPLALDAPPAIADGAAAAAPTFASQIRVAADTLDRLLNQAGEISIARGRIEAEAQTLKQFLLELADSIARMRGQMREIEIQAESRLQATLNQATEHESVFDPLEFDRFTRFQELTRLMAESLHDVATVQRNLIESLEEVHGALSAQSRLNRSLQDELARLRTVPFHQVSERLYRVARQAVRETGKQARFEVLGSQTEIDRGVLDRIAAPLEHLVRNAVAHGIEPPDQRIRGGKPEVGSIRLNLRQEANDLLILLSDDGRGIDYDRIRSRAIEIGLISSEAQPTRGELEQLIFRGGFSTASAVTELAGRGVGMDVVANEVRALGGRIEVSTEIGAGTTFTIRVPLTVVVVNALVVSAAERRWVILSGLVDQVHEVSASALSELYSRREVEWMGQRYPLFYLPELLGQSITPAPDRLKYFAVLIRSGDRRVGVLVEHLAVNQDVVLKQLGPQVSRLAGISGATVLSNGEVALILDPAAFADGAHVGSGKLSKTRNEHPDLAPLVMVVDDSPTVRKVTSRLLARSEFRVATARDGLDALDQIQQAMPDVLLVDIEMPRMDGFDFTKNLKSSARTAHIPIIMITSRLASKHREYARQLGVDVYLGKPYEERELLGHIGRFTASAAAA